MKSSSEQLFDEFRMSECLHLARLGAGYVSPNPMVGAVIVRNGRIISTGYHKEYGGPHAEVHALRAAGHRAKGATLYLNLEPCCHQGKTPPCTDQIIRAKVSRVVVGMKDPNPLVAGKGIRQLRRAGIDVELGLLENDCRKLNESFVKHVVTGMPFVTLKIAQTLDGFIADKYGNSKWITGQSSRRIVHFLRARSDAVLVGANTVAADNPRLTVRAVKGRQPWRVILDGELSSPLRSKVFTDTNRTRTILFTTLATFKKKEHRLTQLSRTGVQVFALPGNRRDRINLKIFLKILSDNGIASLLVEGGADVFHQFISEGIVDKLLVFVAPNTFGSGISPYPPAVRKKLLDDLKPSASMQVGRDVLLEYRH